MWVTGCHQIYAYDLTLRDAGKDFDNLSAGGSGDPSGVWSDGTTMWVADRISRFTL